MAWPIHVTWISFGGGDSNAALSAFRTGKVLSNSYTKKDISLSQNLRNTSEQ